MNFKKCAGMQRYLRSRRTCTVRHAAAWQAAPGIATENEGPSLRHDFFRNVNICRLSVIKLLYQHYAAYIDPLRVLSDGNAL